MQADVIVWDMEGLQILHRLRLHKVPATRELAQGRRMVLDGSCAVGCVAS
jgi:hypothetical protein